MKEAVFWYIHLLSPPILIIVLSSWCFVGGEMLHNLKTCKSERSDLPSWAITHMDLLKRGNVLSLSGYRIWNLAMEIFKCLHGMDPMYLNNLFYKQEMKYNLRDNTLLKQPKFSTKTYGYRSFICYGSTLWNALPFEITNTDNYDDFKLKLKAGVTKVISINLKYFDFVYTVHSRYLVVTFRQGTQEWLSIARP